MWALISARTSAKLESSLLCGVQVTRQSDTIVSKDMMRGGPLLLASRFTQETHRNADATRVLGKKARPNIYAHTKTFLAARHMDQIEEHLRSSEVFAHGASIDTSSQQRLFQHIIILLSKRQRPWRQRRSD